jgi:hypothetical protein
MDSVSFDLVFNHHFLVKTRKNGNRRNVKTSKVNFGFQTYSIFREHKSSDWQCKSSLTKFRVTVFVVRIFNYLIKPQGCQLIDYFTVACVYWKVAHYHYQHQRWRGNFGSEAYKKLDRNYSHALPAKAQMQINYK